MRNLLLFCAGWLVMLTLACNGNQKLLSNSDFGDEWPFTVNSGTVECLGDPFMVIFTSGGVSYALNDAAKSSGEFEEIEAILKIDENYQGRQVKMNTSLIEFEGLKVCDRNN